MGEIEELRQNLEALTMRCQHLELRVAELEKTAKPRRKKEPVPSAPVFEAFAEAYFWRYRTSLGRSAYIMGQMANLVRRLGPERALAAARFYLTLSDALYLKSYHAANLLVRDAEAIAARMEGAQGPGSQGAMCLENAEATARASARYLARKGGQS